MCGREGLAAQCLVFPPLCLQARTRAVARLEADRLLRAREAAVARLQAQALAAQFADRGDPGLSPANGMSPVHSTPGYPQRFLASPGSVAPGGSWTSRGGLAGPGLWRSPSYGAAAPQQAYGPPLTHSASVPALALPSPSPPASSFGVDPSRRPWAAGAPPQQQQQPRWDGGAQGAPPPWSHRGPQMQWHPATPGLGGTGWLVDASADPSLGSPQTHWRAAPPPPLVAQEVPPPLAAREAWGGSGPVDTSPGFAGGAVLRRHGARSVPSQAMSGSSPAIAVSGAALPFAEVDKTAWGASARRYY